MALRYAKDQGVGFTNHISRVAIVGASGNMGSQFVSELLKTGKHTITALTRKGGESKMPKGVKVVTIDYDDEDSIVSALQGHQFFIITLGAGASPDTHPKLVRAASKAGIRYVMPNSYISSTKDEKFLGESLIGPIARQYVADVRDAGLSPIVLDCGFWYEFGFVLGPDRFGFDFPNRKAVFMDEGSAKVTCSTFQQCGRAVAAVLSLKELPENENDKSLTLSSWIDKPMRIASFSISQKDMFNSWKRVTGETDSDWTIEYEPSAERYGRGMGKLQKGDLSGFGLALYSRSFFPSEDANFEAILGLDNGALGLEKEDLDEATKLVKKMVDDGWAPGA